MPDHGNHVRVINEKITALSDALAHLGRGTSLQDLLKIIHYPGYTTPAEAALTVAILDSMSAHVSALAHLEKQLLSGSKLIVEGAQAAA